MLASELPMVMTLWAKAVRSARAPCMPAAKCGSRATMRISGRRNISRNSLNGSKINAADMDLQAERR